MPEVPEITKMRDQLRKLTIGQMITSVSFDGRYAVNPPEHLTALRAALDDLCVAVHDVNVKGKFMYWTMMQTTTDRRSLLTWYLFITHGMSGGWTQHPAPPHPAMTLSLSDGTTLTFNDPRRFGTVHIVPPASPASPLNPDVILAKKLKSLGPDVLNDPETTAIEFKRRLMKCGKDRNVCVALMDQSSLSGIGNYIKSESLYEARISPHRSVGSLNDLEWCMLHNAVAHIVKTSYESGGATLATYSDVEGNEGAAQHAFACYGRRSDPEGNIVKREETLDKRTTWWVPDRQL